MVSGASVQSLTCSSHWLASRRGRLLWQLLIPAGSTASPGSDLGLIDNVSARCWRSAEPLPCQRRVGRRRRPFSWCGRLRTTGGVVVEEAGTANLEKVDHIVVLMMENRSFDPHAEFAEDGRSDVDGLREGLANEYQGRGYPVHHLGTTVIAEDPDHSASSVDLQIGGGKMDGLAASYAATMESLGVENGDLAPIMGYYLALRTSRSTIISPASSPSVIAGSARFRERPGRTACTPCVAARLAAAIATPTTCRRCTTSRRSCATSTRTVSPGAVLQRRWHLADG